MELWMIIVYCLCILCIVVGGYTYMFLHIMRKVPKELEFRKKIGESDTLIPHRYKR